MQALNEEFQKYRPKLELLEEITDYLMEAEKDDPTLVAEIRERFSAVEEPFERLHSNVLQRQARLQNIIIQGQDFQLSLREAQDQLNEFERNIAQLEPISAIYEEVQQQKEDHEVINCFDRLVKDKNSLVSVFDTRNVSFTLLTLSFLSMNETIVLDHLFKSY